MLFIVVLALCCNIATAADTSLLVHLKSENTLTVLAIKAIDSNTVTFTRQRADTTIFIDSILSITHKVKRSFLTTVGCGVLLGGVLGYVIGGSATHNSGEFLDFSELEGAINGFIIGAGTGLLGGGMLALYDPVNEIVEFTGMTKIQKMEALRGVLQQSEADFVK